MSWRWLIYDTTDPQWELTPAQRAKIRKLVDQKHKAESGWRSRPKAIMWVLGSIGLFMIFLGPRILIDLAAANGLNIPRILGSVLAFVLSAILAHIMLAAAWRRLTAEKTRYAAIDIGIDICLGCGYMLKGLPEDRDRCPECGTPFESKIVSSEKHQ